MTVIILPHLPPLPVGERSRTTPWKQATRSVAFSHTTSPPPPTPH
ncbi:hypothetical protein [Nostoc sp. MS1]|nr:hypothetical protein [Nostoc sp. MS1]